MLDNSCESATGDNNAHYVGRVNRAIDHVLQNLDQPLLLEEVAKAACFSPFHFHRVFKILMGETLNQFVKRVRLERALRMISHQPERPLSDIAPACGFSSLSDFSRSFKERYGVSPSAFDVDSFRTTHRSDLEAATFGEAQRFRPLLAGANPDGFKVQLRHIPARCVAYIRVLEPFRPGVVRDAFRRLEQWAGPRSLADGQWLGYMWDDPEIVALADCRYDVGLEVPDVQPEGEIGRFEFPPMLVAQVEVRGGVELELRALDWLFRSWLPSSGYVPAEQPCFESFLGRPFQHGEEYFELYAQLPVERD